MGVSLDAFKAMFEDTLELDENGNPLSDGKIDKGAGESVDSGNGADAGVETPVRKLERRKKGGTEEVHGTQPDAK
jgi:hypothetical protein